VPIGDGKIEGVRTLKRLNQLTQHLAWVLTSAVGLSIEIDRRLGNNRLNRLKIYRDRSSPSLHGR